MSVETALSTTLEHCTLRADTATLAKSQTILLQTAPPTPEQYFLCKTASKALAAEIS